ncbi:POK9 protein, partial [Sylvia atricapilla]|nr:POK9 protein [Sylvia atricapilla]
RGSLGVDIYTTEEVTLKGNEVTAIPTTAYGPMCSTDSLIGAILLGRSSTSKQGVIVLPGLIDADYTGQIHILAFTLRPPMTIPKGSRIAQIVAFENLLPQYQHSRESGDIERGNKGFGLTGRDVFLVLDLEKRPFEPVMLQHGFYSLQLNLLIDTGSDVSILN